MPCLIWLLLGFFPYLFQGSLGWRRKEENRNRIFLASVFLSTHRLSGLCQQSSSLPEKRQCGGRPRYGSGSTHTYPEEPGWPGTFWTSTPLPAIIYLLFQWGDEDPIQSSFHLHHLCEWPICPGGLEPFLSFSVPMTSSSLHFCPSQFIQATDHINNYKCPSSDTLNEDTQLSDGNLPYLRVVHSSVLKLSCSHLSSQVL